MRPIALLFALLVLVGTAAAQPGPQPGYDSAVDYAQAYAEATADEASNDPEGFVAQHDSAEELQADVEHGAYVACWAADDAGVESAACDPFYTPRGEAAPEQPEEAMPVEDFENATINATQEFAAEVQDIANDTVADPGSAPSQVERLLDATKDFLGDMGAAAGTLADALVGGLLACVDGILGAVQGIESVGLTTSDAVVAGIGDALDGIGTGAGAITDGIAGGGLAIGDGVSAASQGIQDALGAAGDGVADAAGAVGDGITDAAKATGTGIADAAKATGGGIADAAQAVGEGIADAAKAVKDTVAGWFGAESSVAEAPKTGIDAPDVTDDATGGLLDGVTGLLS